MHHERCPEGASFFVSFKANERTNFGHKESCAETPTFGAAFFMPERPSFIVAPFLLLVREKSGAAFFMPETCSFNIFERHCERIYFSMPFFIHETTSFSGPERYAETGTFHEPFMIQRNQHSLWPLKRLLKQTVSISLYITLILILSSRFITESDTSCFVVGFHPTRNISFFGVTV